MRQRRTWIFALTLIVPIAAFGAQRTFVSAASGSDANPCSRALPCRSFDAALVLTDSEGEVVVLDSGGYGPTTIADAVSLVAPAGVHAAITAFSGDAITVAAQDSDIVLVRGLQLTGLGADTGVAFDSGRALEVADSVLTGFIAGIDSASTTLTARLYVSNTTIVGSSNFAIQVGGGLGRRATVENTRMWENSHGIFVSSADVLVRDSVAAGGDSAAGYAALASGTIVAERSASTDNLYGFIAQFGGKILISRCAVTYNGTGLSSSNNGEIRVADTIVSGNTLGLSAQTGGILLTRGTNTVQTNGTNGTFTGSIGAD